MPADQAILWWRPTLRSSASVRCNQTWWEIKCRVQLKVNTQQVKDTQQHPLVASSLFLAFEAQCSTAATSEDGWGPLAFPSCHYRGQLERAGPQSEESATPGTWVETRILELCSRPAESETLGGARQPLFSESLPVIPVHPKNWRAPSLQCQIRT